MRGEGDVASWFARVDRELWERSAAPPACWGGQYRLGDPGSYVSDAVFEEVLPTERERSLYLVLANEWDGCGPLPPGVAERAGDEEWLGRRASDACEEPEAVAYYTELMPDDFDRVELRALASERPDLFGAGELAAFPELSRALAPGRGGALSVGTRLGELAAVPWDDGTGQGILVELRKPDGTVGSVCVAEVSSDGAGAGLRTIALDGHDGSEVFECDPAGPEMGYPRGEGYGLGDLEAECGAGGGQSPAPGREDRER